MLSCRSSSDKRSDSDKQAIQNAPADKNKKEAKAPYSFVNDLKKNASTVLQIKLIKVDSVNKNIKVFFSKVLKVYKGQNVAGEELKYVGLADIRIPKNDTLLVFLNKSQQALKHINTFDDLYYFTTEENAMVKYNTQLDSYLK